MGWFIAAIIMAVLGLIVLVTGFKVKYTTEGEYSSSYSREREKVEHKGSKLVKGIGVLMLGLAAVFLVISFTYAQKIGQVVFVLNPGGGLAKVDEEPGFGVKQPWQSTAKWDLFSRDVKYTGQDPSYTAGEITGPYIKAGVKGGTIATFSTTGTYDIRQADFEHLYNTFRSQDRFTRQVIEPAFLTVAKSVPSAYSAVEFRGSGMVAAADEIMLQTNKRLEASGVTFSVVAIGNPDFPDNVEKAIAQVEESQQKEAKAEAELRAAEVSAQTQVVEAEAKAKANDLLDRSLTPEVLESIRLETMRSIGENGNMVVDLDSGANLLLNPTKK